MKLTPLILGALILGPTAGVIVGETINTTPIQYGVDVLGSIPRHKLVITNADRFEQQGALPDHYPLYTPQGRVEVAELSSHGLYSNSRFLPVYYASPFSREEETQAVAFPHLDTLEVMQEPASGKANQLAVEHTALDQSPAVGHGSQMEGWNHRPTTPLAAELEKPKGGPRIIDVAAVLGSY